MIIRGYACPFNSIAVVDGGIRETIAPNAISLAVGHVQLQYGDHAGWPMAWTGDGSLRLWSDRTGLAFEARLDPAERHVWGMYNAVCGGAFDGCSVNMFMRNAVETVIDGVIHRRVRRATIDHVAVSNGVCYRETGVWPADAALDDLPPRVRALALAWDRGREASTIAAHRSRTPSARPVERVSPCGIHAAPLPRAGRADPHVPASVRRVLQLAGRRG